MPTCHSREAEHFHRACFSAVRCPGIAYQRATIFSHRSYQVLQRMIRFASSRTSPTSSCVFPATRHRAETPGRRFQTLTVLSPYLESFSCYSINTSGLRYELSPDLHIFGVPCASSRRFLLRVLTIPPRADTHPQKVIFQCRLTRA